MCKKTANHDTVAVEEFMRTLERLSLLSDDREEFVRRVEELISALADGQGALRADDIRIMREALTIR